MPVAGQMGLCSLWSVRCMLCIVQRDRWQVASGHVSFTGFTWNLIWYCFPTPFFFWILSMHICFVYIIFLNNFCTFTSTTIFHIYVELYLLSIFNTQSCKVTNAKQTRHTWSAELFRSCRWFCWSGFCWWQCHHKTHRLCLSLFPSTWSWSLCCRAMEGYILHLNLCVYLFVCST